MEWPELSVTVQSVTELSPGWLPGGFKVGPCSPPKPGTPSWTQICPFRGFPPPKGQPCCRSPWVGQCQAGQRATSPSQTPARRPPRARPPGASQTTEPNPIQRPPQTPPGTPPPPPPAFFLSRCPTRAGFGGVRGTPRGHASPAVALMSAPSQIVVSYRTPLAP